MYFYFQTPTTMKKIHLLLPILLVQAAFSQTIALTSFATGFTRPVEITHAGDTRLFIVEQTGRIKILNSNGTTNATPFLNLSTLITTAGSEQGLLGLAFHPNYATNGFFFVNYTRLSDGATVIARYNVSADPNIANTTATILLTIPQPFSNHNGGQIKFGPDGFLYIATGDGGSGGDPGNRAQNNTELLGKMLRIDVNSTVAPFYTSPPTNPFVGVAGADEIWATGLRNPWKFSFDSSNGNLWIADVGQNAFEEINRVSSTTVGVNYGWRCFEGNAVFNNTGNCNGITGTTAPFVAVNHNIGSCSITGGYVYNGALYPNLVGKYLFTDFCNPKIGLVTASGTVSYTSDFAGSFSTFGEDLSKELYIAELFSGVIYKISDTLLSTSEFVEQNFKIYPNPSSNTIYIEKSSTNYPILIEIFDGNGKLLVTQKPENNVKTIINTSKLSAGFYIMNITDNLNTTETHKLIIN